MAIPTLDEFDGTDRFAVQRRLGSGTSGAVYEVFDRERKTIVALKTLKQVDPAAIYRFKKEFRALADVNHRNILQLYELLSDGERWFFTMELVKGQSFIDYVRRGAPGAQDLPRADEAPTMLGAEISARLVDRERQGRREEEMGPVLEGLPFHTGRLRDGLRQVAEGLSVLHDAGKLHCDLKPTNVLATPEGRIVLLDLGLVRDLIDQRIYESLQDDIVGTPAYMSPEQGAGLEVSAASDWYSVGVMLYEALTGRLPYTGNIMKILTEKQKTDPIPPRELVEGIPEDLDTLCCALLHRDPDKRPDGHDVLHWLGGAHPSPSEAGMASRATSSSSLSAPFLGREKHLEALVEAFDHTCSGRSVVVFVHGSSGMGKSALVRRFLDEVRHREERAVILAGRCYQRESVPYKALDSLVDSLSRFLRSLPDHEVELLLPYNVLTLARLFPVLKRVKAVAGVRRRALEIPDSRELRRRAFAALRELFQRLCDRSPVVLVIDDLQWGDLDSASLLNELLRPPDPPPLMLVSCFRSEEAMTSPLLRSLFSSELAKVATDVRELVLKEMALPVATELAERLLGERGPASPALAETIARESGGNPFLIDALVRYVQSMTGGEGQSEEELERAVGSATLEKVLEERLSRLPEEARRLLRLVVVAGQPVELEVVKEAGELEGETQTALAALRASRLVRMRGGREREQVESYHDRIRVGLLKLIPEVEQRLLHRRLALALQASGRADPETLAVHFQEAGQRDRAADFATRAADQAAEALAFNRAARLFRLALDLSDGEEGKGTRQLRVRLGDALANAGRGAEAAESYLLAAEGAKTAHALELRRRAAEQLLISGRIDKGLETVRQVLASVGMKIADSPKKALLSLIRRRLHLKMRGIQFKERDSTQISAEELIKIDTCWSVSIGLGFVDTIRGMDFGTLHVLLALKAGEPYRVARALAIEAGYSATAGNKGLERTERLIRASMRLAQKVKHPHALGLATMTAGVAAYLEGQWVKAVERFDRSEEILRERCTGVTWEIDNSFLFNLRALLFCGQYGEICRRLPALLKDVRERGDLFAETGLRTRMAWIAWLVRDEPDQAREEVEAAIARWSQQGFHLQHYWHLTGQTEIAMYSGRATEAWENLEARWTDLAGSLLLRIQFTRTEALHLRSRTALAAAVEAGLDTPEYKKLRKILEGDLRKMEGEKLFWANPLIHLVRAGFLATEGQKEDAEERLERAIQGFEEADMKLYAAVSRLRLGELRGANRGAELMEQGKDFMRQQTIRNPERIAAFVAPGGWS